MVNIYCNKTTLDPFIESVELIYVADRTLFEYFASVNFSFIQL